MKRGRRYSNPPESDNIQNLLGSSLRTFFSELDFRNGVVVAGVNQLTTTYAYQQFAGKFRAAAFTTRPLQVVEDVGSDLVHYGVAPVQLPYGFKFGITRLCSVYVNFGLYCKLLELMYSDIAYTDVEVWHDFNLKLLDGISSDKDLNKLHHSYDKLVRRTIESAFHAQRFARGPWEWVPIYHHHVFLEEDPTTMETLLSVYKARP